MALDERGCIGGYIPLLEIGSPDSIAWLGDEWRLSPVVDRPWPLLFDKPGFHSGVYPFKSVASLPIYPLPRWEREGKGEGNKRGRAPALDSA